MLEQRVKRFLIVWLSEKIRDGFGDDLTKSFDIIDLCPLFRADRGGAADRAQRLERAEMAGEATRVGLANMADAKCENKTVQRRFAGRLDRPEKIAG